MITLMIGNVVGLIAVNICKDYGINSIVAYDNKVLYKELGFKVFDSITEVDSDYRILLSVHGREIVPDNILNKYIHCVNVHPFYNKFKGKSPVQRALLAGCKDADVTAHKMTNKVDEGDIICQETKIIVGKTLQEIYSELYPLYARVIKETVEYYITDDKHYSILCD